ARTAGGRAELARLDADRAHACVTHGPNRDTLKNASRKGSILMNRSPIHMAAMVVGLGFLAAGVGGFIPGITTNAGDIAMYGHDSPAKLLGIFQVSVLHNVIHLAFGLAGLLLARSAAKIYLIGGGLIYLV